MAWVHVVLSQVNNIIHGQTNRYNNTNWFWNTEFITLEDHDAKHAHYDDGNTNDREEGNYDVSGDEEQNEEWECHGNYYTLFSRITESLLAHDPSKMKATGELLAWHAFTCIIFIFKAI